MLDRFGGEVARYPSGTLMRNPPTTAPKPGFAPECALFVKWWQFDMADRNPFRKTMADELILPVDGVATPLSYRNAREVVRYHELAPGTTLTDR